MEAAVGQVLAMGMLTWLGEKLLSEGECCRWGRRALELVLLCRSVGILLADIL